MNDKIFLKTIEENLLSLAADCRLITANYPFIANYLFTNVLRCSGWILKSHMCYHVGQEE